MSNPVTLQTLLDPQSQPQVFGLLIAQYQAAGFPTQSWQPFGVERTRLMAIATAVSQLSAAYIPIIAAGGFLGYATGGWLTLLAQQNYLLPRNPSGFTIGTIHLNVGVAAGPYTITDGSIKVTFGASGNSYISNGNGTVVISNGTNPNPIKVYSETTGAKYSDPSNSGSISLTTSLPGVTVDNIAPAFSPISVVGASLGTVTVGGTPTAPHNVVITIVQSGEAGGTALFSYSLDGAPDVLVGALPIFPATAPIGTTLITVGFNNIPPGTGTSFIQNDEFLFATPGSWISQQGVDDETDANLSQRCVDRWSTLSPIPVANFYDIMVRTVPGVLGQVTQTLIQVDSVENQRVNCVIAGPVGPLPPSIIAAVQSYVNLRVPITDLPIVFSPASIAITILATILVDAAYLQSASLAIQNAIDNYINGVGINGTVRLSEIIRVICDQAGVVDVTPGTTSINGSTTSNLVLPTVPNTWQIPSDQAPFFTFTPTYVTV